MTLLLPEHQIWPALLLAAAVGVGAVSDLLLVAAVGVSASSDLLLVTAVGVGAVSDLLLVSQLIFYAGRD